MGNRETYSRNQCTLLIRVDGQELEIPCNFGLTAREIKAIYPYLAKMANTKMPNPALIFEAERHDGRYADLSEDEYVAVLEQMKKQADFWYQKPEASLLDLSVRFALDIYFRGIQEIQDAFSTVTPFDHIKVEKTVSREEAETILKSMETAGEADAEASAHPVGEKDIEKGTAGDMPIDIYGTGDTGSFADDMQQAASEKTEDRFEKVVNGDSYELPDEYKSTYKAGGFDEKEIGEDGLLNIYGDVTPDEDEDVPSDPEDEEIPDEDLDDSEE